MIRWRIWLLRIGCLLGSLLLVAPGFTQGIGATPEEVRRVAIAIEMVTGGDWNPHWFGHPASLLLYGLALAYKLFAWLAGGLDLRELYLRDPTLLFLIGRALARLAAAASVVLTFELGRRFLPLGWAILAAALTAMNPVFVMSAHRLRVDHLLSLFLLIGVFLLIRMQRSQERKPPFGIAAVAAIAVSYKYTAAALLVDAVLSFLARWGFGRRQLWDVVRAIAVFGVVLFVCSPYLLLDWQMAWRDIAGEVGKKSGWNPLISLSMIIDICRYSFTDVGCLLLALGGLRFVLDRRWARWQSWRDLFANSEASPLRAIAMLTVLYCLITLSASTYNATWLAPLVPMLALLLTDQARRLSQGTGLSRKPSARFWRSLAVVVLVSSLAGQASELHTITRMRLRPGNTALAQAWLASHVKPGQRVLLLQAAEQAGGGLYPRIAVADVQLDRVAEDGTTEPICREEGGDRYGGVGRLEALQMCYPRPSLRSFSAQSLAHWLRTYDFVVVASDAALSAKQREWLAQNQPVLALPAPQIRQRLAYPVVTNFPHGDYGNWRGIHVYARQPSPSGLPNRPQRRVSPS